MKPLIKIMLTIGVCFMATFFVIRFFNLLSIDDIETWLTTAKDASPLLVGAIVIALLFADLFVAVPTLTITILAGYFLGAPQGIFASLTGMILAGVCGYAISQRYGPSVLQKIMRNPENREHAIATFKQNGFTMIILSRAMPILPEVTACLAGLTYMPFARFILAWCISTVPYVTIAAYAGSISSLTNPQPAIYTAISITATMWAGWLWFHHHKQKTSTAKPLH